MRAPAVVLAVLVWAGSAGAQEPSWRDSYEAFVAAMQAGDEKAAHKAAIETWERAAEQNAPDAVFSKLAWNAGFSLEAEREWRKAAKAYQNALDRSDAEIPDFRAEIAARTAFAHARREDFRAVEAALARFTPSEGSQAEAFFQPEVDAVMAY
ncbi:MAG: hypothetical protein ACFB2Z_05535 [Maricaulaceae bacterium]